MTALPPASASIATAVAAVQAMPSGLVPGVRAGAQDDQQRLDRHVHRDRDEGGADPSHGDALALGGAVAEQLADHDDEAKISIAESSPNPAERDGTGT